MVAFIDDHKREYGVEPICRVLPIAPSTYYWHKAREADPSLCSARAQRDELLKPEIRRVWDENFKVYGSEKFWEQLNREGIAVARCTVARIMAEMGLKGAVRGHSFKVTTHAADGTERPLDLVDRNFTASRPNELWVSDLTYVRMAGRFAYVAFVVDVFARFIVGWQVSSSLRSDLALDALEQAIGERLGGEGERLVHHSDRGVQYLAFRYTERLALHSKPHHSGQPSFRQRMRMLSFCHYGTKQGTEVPIQMANICGSMKKTMITISGWRLITTIGRHP
jgi:transposase InsO family protein